MPSVDGRFVMRSQLFTLPDDKVVVSRSELRQGKGFGVYLDALERYLLANDNLDRKVILYLLRLLQSAAREGFDKTEALLEYSDREASAIAFGDVLIGGNDSEADEEQALLYQYVKKERLERERRKEALYKSEIESNTNRKKPPYWTEKLTRTELYKTRKLFRVNDLRNLAHIPEGSFILDKLGRAWWKITSELSTRKLNGKRQTKTLYCR